MRKIDNAAIINLPPLVFSHNFLLYKADSIDLAKKTIQLMIDRYHCSTSNLSSLPNSMESGVGRVRGYISKTAVRSSIFFAVKGFASF